MLVLTRRTDESIIINDVIKIIVVEIRGDKVRLGIEAPREIDVHRQEVYEAIQYENRRAAQMNPAATRKDPVPTPPAPQVPSPRTPQPPLASP